MSLKKKSMKFTAGTLFSRFSGLLRESIITATFGASQSLDAFLIAYRIPNLLRELIAEGAFGASFTKTYTSLYEDEPERADRLLKNTLGWAVFLLMGICGLGIIFAPSLVSWMSYFQEDAEFHQKAVSLTRILFPFIGLMTIGAVAGGVLHQKGVFFLTAVSPTLLNAGAVFGALVLAHQYKGGLEISGLAWGVLLGGFCQMSLQVWAVRSRWTWGLPEWNDDVRAVLRLMGPMVIAGSAAQVNVVINTNFAMTLETGSVTWLNQAFRILQLPVGLFAVAIGTVILPMLSRAKTSVQKYQYLQEGCESVLWLHLWCLVIILYSAESIVDVLFGYGKFLSYDVSVTSSVLQCYAMSLPAYGLLKVLNAYYYAQNRTSWPMWVGLFSIGVNLLSNTWFVNHYGVYGLAISLAIVLSLNASLLILGLYIGDCPRWNMKSLGLFAVLAALSIAGCSYVLEMASWSPFSHQKLNSLMNVMINALIAICFFGISYGAQKWMLRNSR
ncbi:MAG: murein biosynthesis integral membrane protein MurJ [Oligoflexales bacterium]